MPRFRPSAIAIGLICACPMSLGYCSAAWAGEPAFLASCLTDADLVLTQSEEKPVTYLSGCGLEPGCDLTVECADGAPCDCGDEAGCCGVCRCGQRGGCCCRNKSTAKPDPCANSHKAVFYDNDFSYLEDPCYRGCCLGDCMKLMPTCCCGNSGTVDVGGQLRLRYHHEIAMDQQGDSTRFQNTENDFMLTRLRLYTNWQANDNVRFYVEGIYAGVTGSEDYIPRPTDQNFGDFLDLFVDLKLTESTTLRVGRQELIYGAQRLVSPLDWSNTRRKFEGVKLIYREGDWDVQGFFTHFVPVIANQLDRADYDQAFYGVYGVYSGCSNYTVDLYYLGYDDTRSTGTPAPPASDFSLHTIGARINGSRGDWLYELEGGPQFGRQSGLGLDQAAGFATAGLGRRFANLPWSPTVWVYYDYASGNQPGGDFNRFNQLFPLAHRYLGFIDATKRENIEAPNLLVTMSPHQKLKLLLWYYHFMSNSASDSVQSIGGTPVQSTVSNDWGDELDVLAAYTIGPRSNVLVGWSHFWAGNKITPPGGAVDADFFYVQWELNF